MATKSLWQRWRRARLAAVPVFALLSGAVLIGAGRMLVVVEPIAQPDAIVSLAGHEWERLPTTAELAARAPSARVLLSLPIAVNAYNCHDCAHRIDRLVEAGVARDRIEVLPRRVYRTLDEAQAVKEWAAQHGARSVVIVTSPYHTRRALASFRHVMLGSGITVGVAPAAAPARPGWWFLHKYDRWYVFYEWRARLFYLVRFGLW